MPPTAAAQENVVSIDNGLRKCKSFRFDHVNFDHMSDCNYGSLSNCLNLQLWLILKSGGPRLHLRNNSNT